MEEKNLQTDKACCARKDRCCSKPCWQIVMIVAMATIIFIAGYGVGRLAGGRHFSEHEGCSMMRYNKQNNDCQRQYNKNEQIPVVTEQVEQPTSTSQN